MNTYFSVTVAAARLRREEIPHGSLEHTWVIAKQER
jgi:hypothetical protein